jgi:hypothetical protein
MNRYLSFITQALLDGISLGVSIHQKNGTFLPTMEIHELREAQ